MVLMPNKDLMAKKPHSLCSQWNHNSFIDWMVFLQSHMLGDGRIAMNIRKCDKLPVCSKRQCSANVGLQLRY
uniref:Uncharacterized protein n=1 Tax=Arundo donax TaxID=35708 RepID=A0A0A9BLB5_ARUDO